MIETKPRERVTPWRRTSRGGAGVLSAGSSVTYVRHRSSVTYRYTPFHPRHRSSESDCTSVTYRYTPFHPRHRSSESDCRLAELMSDEPMGDQPIWRQSRSISASPTRFRSSEGSHVFAHSPESQVQQQV